ncbi:hypothetical protein [Oerskovia sp. Root22]|uniref:hypothetical protein n=1 Tax=Oerskovia sp. Root22 TaxID=1736494 RepID=UPI0006F86C81|nr:hypothetical protein [Oerskovia sp. Root22]KRC36975.1 hypothetical protein ASE15_08100 [Oerskovia sp. Root22]
MADNGSTRTTDRRGADRRHGEKGGALALTGAVIAWGVALIHLVNGFTRPLGIIDVRSISPSGGAQERESMSVSAVEGTSMPWTDVYLHRPLDKIDLILFFALVGTACFLGYLLARRGARGAQAVLDGSSTSRWLGIVLVAVGVVPALAQQQGSLARLADAGLEEVLAPVDPELGWGWIVAGLGLVVVVPALQRAVRRRRD